MLIAFFPARQCVWIYYLRPRVGAKERRCLHLRVAKSNRVISLLQELFPQECKNDSFGSDRNLKRKVPRLALDESTFEKSQFWKQSKPPAGPKKGLERLENKDDITILTVQQASKFLTEDDFRRIIPTSKHIDGWTYRGDIIKVIKGRDISTLENDGTYFILFSTLASANAYKSHITWLHQTARSTGTNSLATNLPGALARGRDVQPSSGLMEAYALFPPSQDMVVKVVKQPFPPLVKKIIDGSGYEMLNRKRRSNYEVLVTVEGGLINGSELEKIIARDSRMRGTCWGMIDPRLGIRYLPVSDGSNIVSGNQQEVESRLEGVELRRDALTKFIISFENEMEARRFVMAWNQRDVSTSFQNVSSANQPTIATAEVIW